MAMRRKRRDRKLLTALVSLNAIRDPELRRVLLGMDGSIRWLLLQFDEVEDAALVEQTVGQAVRLVAGRGIEVREIQGGVWQIARTEETPDISGSSGVAESTLETIEVTTGWRYHKGAANDVHQFQVKTRKVKAELIPGEEESDWTLAEGGQAVEETT